VINVVGLDCQKYVLFELFWFWKLKCEKNVIEKKLCPEICLCVSLSLNMVIMAHQATRSGIYDAMLSVKKGLKDCIKDKFYGFKVRQVLEKLSITQKSSFETAAIKIYERALSYLKEWFDFKNSPFRTSSCLSL
jgi:hypothetical protein